MSASNYDFTNLSNGTLSIDKAHLTVSADSQSRLYGAANPTFTQTVSGFVNSETVSTAAGFTGAGSATTTANATTPVGTAVITAGAGNLAATNYNFTNLVDGTLTLQPAKPSVVALKFTPQVNYKTQTLNLSPTLTVTYSAGTKNELLSSQSINPAADSTRMGVDTVVMGPTSQIMNIGATGTTLQILNGGMRLPGTLINNN